MVPALTGFNYTFQPDQNGNTLIAKNSYCSLVNSAGKVIIPRGKYIYIKPLTYDESCAPSVLYQAETLYGIDLYDDKGNRLSAKEYANIWGCRDGMLSVRTRNDYSGIIDTKGNEVIPTIYESARVAADRLIVVGKNNKTGVITPDSKEVIPFIYDKIEVKNKDSIYVYTGPRDSIWFGSRESYELDAYFNGKLKKNVEKNIRINALNQREPLTLVEQMPLFPGCNESKFTDKDKLKMCAEKEMLMFIYNNIKYPTLARIHGIEGMAVVSFIVEKDGFVTDPKILRDVKAGCGDEALKIVRRMPKWKPGTQDGKPVRVQFNLPVRFKLEG